MKLAIVYFSKTGRTEQMAEEIKKGMLQATPEAEIKLIPVAQYAENREEYDTWIAESCGVVFGTPDYYASEAWQMREWMHTSSAKLANKLGGVYVTANMPQGGMTTAIMNIVTEIMVKGMLVYSGGTSCGQPFIHLGPVCFGPDMTGKELFSIFGQRFAAKAKELFA